MTGRYVSVNPLSSRLADSFCERADILVAEAMRHCFFKHLNQGAET